MASEKNRIRFIQKQGAGDIFERYVIYVNGKALGDLIETSSGTFNIYVDVEKLDAREDKDLTSNYKSIELDQSFYSAAEAKTFFRDAFEILNRKYIFHFQD